jgi:hypothetical protein
MIPSLLEVGYYFTWVPVWEDEPVSPAPEQPPSGESAAAEVGSEPETEAAAPTEPGGDADGVNDEVAVRRIFKGYRLEAMPDYTATAFSGYVRYIDNRQDEDIEHGRRDEHARRAVSPHPGSTQAPEQLTAPDAPDSPDGGD